MSPDRLSPAERTALGTLSEHLDFDRVRIWRDRRGAAGLARRLVLTLSGGRAVALGDHVFVPAGAAGDLALLAHELTHCGQYQRWGALRYFGRGLREQLQYLGRRTLGVGRNPYDYRAAPAPDFHRCGMEQQGQIVEDCFRGDPVARRLSPYHPRETTIDAT